jgi:hypothetical protein
MGFLSIKVVKDFGALSALSTGVLVGKITKNSQDGNDNTKSTVSKEGRKPKLMPRAFLKGVTTYWYQNLRAGGRGFRSSRSTSDRSLLNILLGLLRSRKERF